jgi:hypothetical protein
LAILWTVQTHEREDYAAKKYGSDNTRLQGREMSKRWLRMIDSSDPPLAKGARDPRKSWEPVLDLANLKAELEHGKELATPDQNWNDGSQRSDRYGQDDERAGLLLCL